MQNPPHPGRGLKADLDALGVSTSEAADALSVSRSQLHRVIAGRSAISSPLAVRLEVVIGGTAEAWLRLQAAHDAAEARKRDADFLRYLKKLEPRRTDDLPKSA